MLTEQISSSYLAPDLSRQSRALESVAKKGSAEQRRVWRPSTALLKLPSAASSLLWQRASPHCPPVLGTHPETRPGKCCLCLNVERILLKLASDFAPPSSGGGSRAGEMHCGMSGRAEARQVTGGMRILRGGTTGGRGEAEG